MSRLRIPLLVCCLVLAFGIVGCGTGGDNAAGDNASDGNNASTGATTDTAPDEGASATDSTAYLTPSDLEQVTGMSGITLAPYDPSTGAGGTLNFATSDGTLITLLSVFTADDYELAKETEGWAAEEVAGIGDEAFLGPEGSPYYLYFRSGDLGFGLSSFFQLGGTTYLTTDQLKELAAIVLSRI